MTPREPDLDAHLASIVAGDAEAFARWMAGGEPALRASLRRYAAAVDVEAVLQETLLRLWQVAPRVTPDGHPNSLLRLGYRVARNLAISELRRAARRRPIDPTLLAETRSDTGGSRPAADRANPAVGSHVSVSPPDPLLRKTIEKCRELLPGRPAQALAARLASEGGEPDRTLAARLSMRTNTFLQNISRARKLLGDCLRRHGVDLRVELR